MTRRVVLGRYNDGVTFGLRVSHAGTDALTGDSNIGDFSFDSEWTDIAQLHVVGLTSWSSAAFQIPNPPNPPINIPGFAANWPALGYMPFIEVRQLTSGVVVFDDFFDATNPNGFYVGPSSALPDGFTFASSANSLQLLYIVYKIPVPSQ